MSLNWKYRQNLIKNADKIITLNQTFKCIEQPVFQQPYQITNTTYLYTSCVDRAEPAGYETSNLKKVFLEKQLQRCTLIAPEFK